MEQKAYWNGVANDKEFTTPFRIELFARHVKSDAVIVDVGCGYGRTLEELYRSGYRKAKGIDFSEAMIARGKAQYPHLDLSVQATKRIDFADESCDAVTLCAVLTCIIGNEDQRDLFGEIKRVLKPGGIVYINDFLLNSDARNLERYKAFEDKYRTWGVFELPEGAILRHHDIDWVEECVQPFERLLLERIVYKTMNGNESNGYCYLGRKKG